MDSAMDSASTTSDHSIASSNDSRGRNLSSPAMPHAHNGSSHTLDKTRTPTPVSPVHNSHSHSSSLNHASARQLASSPAMRDAPQAMMMPHPLSPPHVSTPSAMAMVGMPPRMSNLSHIPPHGLGLLNSFMHHASPLDLMAAAHHHVPPRSYNSPPPISSSDPTANECKLVDYRGHKVAAFMIQGETMLCLPQAFELFLKHLVGGLHTVYTKLKRLDIVPLVCNVEQVRILRGLGAIQPGVNRCKLLSCKDFDVLYRDCTTARCLSIKPPESSRPGRPPKRGPVGLSMPGTPMSHHAAAAAAVAASQIKKHRLDNGEFVYENGHLSDLQRMDKSPLLANGYNAPPTHLNHLPFMQMNPHGPGGGHPLMSPGVNPHAIQRPDGSIIKGQNIPGMEAIARAAYEDIVKHLERLREERGEDRVHASMEPKPRDLSSQNGTFSIPSADSPHGASPVLNLSKSGGDQASGGAPSERSNQNSPEPSVHEEDDNMSEANMSDGEEPNEKEDDISDCERDITSPMPATVPVSQEMDSRQQAALNYSSLAATAAAVAVGSVPSAQDPVLSSTETLLRNIQGLLKVAADNARQQERQTSYEKAELKMDVIREREVKDSMERQLADEKRLRGLYQKRFKKERRLRIQLKDRLDGERKRRTQLEEIIKAAGAPTEALRIIAENISNDEQREKEREREREAERERIKEREKDRSGSMSGGNGGGSEGKLRDKMTGSDSRDRNERGTDSDRMRSEREMDRDQIRSQRDQERDRERGGRGSSVERYSKEGSPVRSSRGASQEVSPPQAQIPEGKPWNYPGLDIMATGAFWQNYSESLAHELELERKVRQQAAEGDVKGPLQDRSNYYKNSVLYSSAT
ncbi:dachshund homolog 2 isoform X3 [Uranotaenia lowii]|uniref:dachshund homolog 2 isoform X3 n=1 Tax=Uranotaenia lowii TaxID=190385 RepID=UPI00247AB136|nr:dachshund homolog 2 isoform X3 [Uranotaenia lowii]